MDPCLRWSGDSSTQHNHVLNDAECLLLRELEESVKDDPSTERKANEGDGTHTQLSMYQNIGEDTTC